MAKLELMPTADADLQRILDYLVSHHVSHPASKISDIVASLRILGQNPNIGRLAQGGKQELLIGSRPHGYRVLYRYLPDIDTVFVLAIRSQRLGNPP
ncbi:type II toxin-antitoxin system RelE/ParE family toxin [Oxalobacteraceae bacterium A2-2]